MRRRIRMILLWCYERLLPRREYDANANLAGNFHTAWAAKRQDLLKKGEE